MENFLPLRREIRNHWIYQDSDYLKVWIDILFNARFSKEPKTDIYKGTMYTINYSEFLYSRPSYAERLNITESKLRKLIDNLVLDGMIEKTNSLGRNKATVYKVLNYEKYNKPPTESIGVNELDYNINQLEANSKPTRSQLEANSKPLKKNDKEQKNENNISVDKPQRKNFIPPTVKEVDEYCKERKNFVDSQRFIDFYESKGWIVGKSKMKDWKAAIRTWEKNNNSNSSYNAGVSNPKLTEYRIV